jgi:hypothetical protein
MQHKTRQTHAAGAGFLRVVKFEPAPVTVTTRDSNPHGFINPSHSLSVGRCDVLGLHGGKSY